MRSFVCFALVGWIFAVGVCNAEDGKTPSPKTEGTVVIRFEAEEGFPKPGKRFTGLGIPRGVVTDWTGDSPEDVQWVIDTGPGGVLYAEAPKPVSGKQFAALGQGSNGVNVGTVHLSPRANVALASFHWAWRGNGNSRPGGNAWLEVEYYDLRGKLLGTEKFQGGLAPDWTPRFELATVAARFRKAPLSKVIFRGVPPDPTAGHGTFLLDDVTLVRKERIPELMLVRNGRPLCTIVVPKDAPYWTRTAAQWLQEYIRKSSGAELKILPEQPRPAGTLISVGHTRLAAEAGITADDLKWDGCKLVVKGNVLYLIGRDQKKRLKSHPYLGARGTCRAVLVFLEEFCGIRWFLPGPEGEYVPRLSEIFVPKDLERVSTPAFAYSDGRSTYDENILDEPGKSIAALANNFRKAVLVAPGGHTYYHAIPMSKYYKDHPEYYALIDGKRTPPGEHPWHGHHLCSSNPDVKKVLVEYIRRRFDEGFDWQSLGQEDGYRRCRCPNCEKLDNYRWEETGMEWEVFQATKLRETPPERVFLLHKAVIDEVAKSHPDKKVVLMAYGPTTWPSKKIDYFGDNVIVEIMDPNPEVIKAWRGKAAGMACKVDWFNTQCPMGWNIGLTPREMAERLRFFHRCGVVGFTHYAEANWGLQGPTFYTLGKLMGDPSLDPDALVAEYCRGVYGGAGDTMLEFFNLLYERLEKVLPLFPNDMAANGRNFWLPRRGITTVEMYLHMYPPKFLDRLDGLLKKAEKEADSERARGWVRLSRDMFDFTNLLTRALISYRAWQANPTLENWAELKERVDAFEAYRMKIISYAPEYVARWFPGHGTFCNWMTADLQKETLTYYVPWEKRKPEVLRRGVRGMAMGHGESYYYSFIREPLTLDFSKEPPAR